MEVLLNINSVYFEVQDFVKIKFHAIAVGPIVRADFSYRNSLPGYLLMRTPYQVPHWHVLGLQLKQFARSPRVCP